MPPKTSPRRLTDAALALIAGRFKVLSDVSRLKLLAALEQGEQNVSELVRATGIAQANVSRHLQALTDAGLVSRRRSGAKIYYAIADSSIFSLCQHVCGSLQKQMEEHAKKARLFTA